MSNAQDFSLNDLSRQPGWLIRLLPKSYIRLNIATTHSIGYSYYPSTRPIAASDLTRAACKILDTSLASGLRKVATLVNRYLLGSLHVLVLFPGLVSNLRSFYSLRSTGETNETNEYKIVEKENVPLRTGADFGFILHRYR